MDITELAQTEVCITITAIPAITIQILGEFRLDLGTHTLSRILRVIVALKAIQVTDLHMGLVIVAKVIQISGLDMAAVTPLAMEARADLLWEAFSQDLVKFSPFHGKARVLRPFWLNIETINSGRHF